VINHVETDYLGSLKEIIHVIFCSFIVCKNLLAHFHLSDLLCETVRNGDTLKFGDRTAPFLGIHVGAF